MKKMILFLVFVLTVGFTYRIVLAESQNDTSAIKKVIEDYLEAIANRDLDLVMNQISTNYSGLDDRGNVMDYAKFKSTLGERLENLVNTSITDLKINNLDIQDNKATLEMEYNFKGLNLTTTNDFSVKLRRLVSLIREDGSWKIIQFQFKPTGTDKPDLKTQSIKSKP